MLLQFVLLQQLSGKCNMFAMVAEICMADNVICHGRGLEASEITYVAAIGFVVMDGSSVVLQVLLCNTLEMTLTTVLSYTIMMVLNMKLQAASLCGLVLAVITGEAKTFMFDLNMHAQSLTVAGNVATVFARQTRFGGGDCAGLGGGARAVLGGQVSLEVAWLGGSEATEATEES